MHTVLVLTSLMAFLSGCAVLAFGKLQHLTLRHEVMILSTLISFFVTGMIMVHPDAIECNGSSVMCLNWGLYAVAGNVRVILFHYIVGRAAIRLKNQERRGAITDDGRQRSL